MPNERLAGTWKGPVPLPDESNPESLARNLAGITGMIFWTLYPAYSAASQRSDLQLHRLTYIVGRGENLLTRAMFDLDTCFASNVERGVHDKVLRKTSATVLNISALELDYPFAVSPQAALSASP